MLAFVSFPGAPLTESLIRSALKKLDESIVITDTRPMAVDRLLQYCGYDVLDHELTHSRPATVLASSYTIRKSLVRKHFLHRAISQYLAKHPDSVLTVGVPRTWDIEIAWADELDELLADELSDLAALLENGSGKWYILKAGMADGGAGIALFNSKETLRLIFEEYDQQTDTESESEVQAMDASPAGQDIISEVGHGIVTSQLRHFVIQEYLDRPLLVNPLQKFIQLPAISPAELPPYKFHLRAYCIAAGALTLYLWPHILALFSSVPYSSPCYDKDGILTLAPHLTNTVLHANCRDANVRLLTELSGCSILSMDSDAVITDADIEDILNQTAHILADAFRAALASSVHFQPIPNAFELFGADLLVTHALSGVDDQAGPRFQVILLEFNAEPAIALTSPRLRWVLEDMFDAIARVCIGPFLGVQGCKWESWNVGETKEGMRKCLEIDVRGLGIWR